MRVLGAPRHAEQPGPFPGERRPELPAKVSEAAPKPAPGAARGGAAPGRPDHAVTPGLRRAPSPSPARPAGRLQPLPRALLLWRHLGSGTAERPLPLFGTSAARQGDAERAQLARDPPPRATRVTPDEPRAEEPRRGAAAAGTRNAAGGTAARRSPGGAARLCWLQR